MKKIVFSTIPMSTVNFKPVYKINGFDELFYFPISVTLSGEMDKDDEMNFCTIRVVDSCDQGNEARFQDYYKKFTDEIKKINTNGAKLNFTVIETNFMETKDVFAESFFHLFETLSENVTIYADITFGPRPFSMIIMNILYFAEKFYNANIETIVYGKTTFIKKGTDKPAEPDSNNSRVCDISILYHLNNLTANIPADNGEEAKQILKQFFCL